MREVFADSWYWIAILNPSEEGRASSATPQAVRIITTDEVLIEFLNYFSRPGRRRLRERALALLDRIQATGDVTVIPQSRDSFLAGLNLYRRRRDKDYSVTDCISMAAMRKRGITAVLTDDRHFAHEGFTILH